MVNIYHEKYGRLLNKTTIGRIWKNREEILKQSYLNNLNQSRTRLQGYSKSTISEVSISNLTFSRPYGCAQPYRLQTGFSTLIHNGIIVDQVNDHIFCQNLFVHFLGELEYLFLQKNLKSLQNIFENNLQKKIRLFFHHDIVESAPERILLNRGL